MLKIEIKDTQVHEKSGTSKTGKAYSIREQDAWVELNGERRRIRVGLRRDQSPHAPGFYSLAPASFYVGKYGSLSISAEPVLLSLPDAAKPKAA